MRLGIDWGGTKMEIVALDAAGAELHRERIATPRDDYAACIEAVAGLVARAEAATGRTGTLGLGIPGSISPATGLVKNANSTWMNGKPLDRDLEERLGRPVRIENDANCLAVSEATDGAGAGAAIVHAIIIGTGCGSGIAINGRAHRGANGIAGEWGNIPVPWMSAEEFPGPECWTGHRGTIDRWCSGTGLQIDHERATGERLSGHDIVAAMRAGNPEASASYRRYVSRLGRAMAMAANLIDPDVFVLGGGLSNVDELYQDLPAAMAPYIFSDAYSVPIRRARHGDSSGVRGAAWLWGG
ncbi:ROK family protein [Polymorphum gilvum]|uniref:Putative kinase/transcriptional regulator, actin-like ATPase domain (NagC/XylR (ROK) familiy) n=1 Tax=Polymorphum gilvum (strain LMG 25793 / CGMCC 1.9160 / SL003B-26A1) TaxID=991905 RepID=F2J4D3_POLGS|nr:ROK family protein [Polymorphum gilvum]ADZ71075.1 Putative kinase/transcriptional regulator, actin-like ATPase domain (NagC/XylR (ROK) familiy) [Polymorphum gilvum SL003B-26A1]